jgi:hypothetical protein
VLHGCEQPGARVTMVLSSRVPAAALIEAALIEAAQIEATLIKALRRAMADAHPDRGGTAEQFIQARRRYETVLGSARR